MQNQEKVLLRIANGEDAEDILKEKYPTAGKRFMNAAKNLRKILDEVKREFPDAQYYTASGGLKLLLGNPHAGAGCEGRAQPELIAESASHIIVIGDGDF